MGMESPFFFQRADLTDHDDLTITHSQMARPLDFEWRLVRYADSAQRLLRTDVDRLASEEKVGASFWDGAWIHPSQRKPR